MDIILSFSRDGKPGVGTLTARYGDEVLHVERLTLSKSKDRGAFVDEIIKDRPGIDRAAVESELRQIAADELKPPEPRATLS